MAKFASKMTGERMRIRRERRGEKQILKLFMRDPSSWSQLPKILAIHSEICKIQQRIWSQKSQHMGMLRLFLWDN